MVKFYNNRELSEMLDINLARWKRWSREFLPPDPLAGQQAGYARQYYVDHAFTVFLGGHLVSVLGFSIPEARRILDASRDWMKTRGFHFDPRGKRQPRKGIDAHVKHYALHIGIADNQGVTIFARGSIGRIDYDYEGYPVTKAVYVDQPISPANGRLAQYDATGSERVLLISNLLENFRKTLDPDGDFFPGLREDQVGPASAGE
jgi:hypothetical protein